MECPTPGVVVATLGRGLPAATVVRAIRKPNEGKVKHG